MLRPLPPEVLARLRAAPRATLSLEKARRIYHAYAEGMTVEAGSEFADVGTSTFHRYRRLMGFAPRAETRPSLAPAKIRLLREAFRAGTPRRRIADRFDISIASVRDWGQRLGFVPYGRLRRRAKPPSR